MPPPAAPPAPALAACERWFVKRGVPHFMQDYDAREDIWTRALPVLVVIYILRGLYALDLDDSLGANLLALLLVLVVLVATWAIANLLRRRPMFAWPREVGAWELAVFVLGPEIPVMLVSQWGDAAKATVLGLATLLLVYIGTSYGVVPMVRWAGQRSLALLESIGSVLSRALPLLLVTITFLFLASEVWEVFGNLVGLTYWMTLGLFVAIGTVFVFSRLPGDLAAAGSLTSWTEVRELVADTPAAALEVPAYGTPPPAELSRRETINVALVGLFARAMQILVVTVGVGAFLTLFGTLAIGESTASGWVGTEVNALWSFTIGDRELVLTEELLRVAGFLAVFAGLSFTVYLVTDPTYRHEFRTDVASEVREAFAVRAAYRYALGRDGAT